MRRAARRRWRWLALAILCALVPCALFAGRPLVVQRSVGDPEIIASLSSHEWERLPEAASLAARYPAALVVLTLPQQVSVHNCHDCSHRVDRLVSAGVSRHRIRVVPLTQGGTYGEAVAVRTVVSDRRARRVLLVTSPYHARRALRAFRAVLSDEGAEVGVVPTLDLVAVHPDRWWLYGYDRWYVSYEWAASIYYAVKYGVPLA